MTLNTQDMKLDRKNFGNSVCLSYIMPRLNDEDDLVKIAALKALERIGDPNTNQLFMELKIVILKSSNLPKKDKYHSIMEPRWIVSNGFM